MQTGNSLSDIQDVEAMYRRAARAEHEKSLDEAFKLYVTVAQSYLQLLRTAASEQERAKYRSEANKCLQRAENIKAAKKDLVPVARDPLSDAEQAYVLDMSSHINSLHVPLWDIPHTANPRDQPLLPAFAKERNTVWRKPGDMYPDLTYASTTLQPDDILQNITTDCSVCTSISVCLQHHRLSGSKLLLSSMYPQNAEGFPVTSEDGIYYLRLYVNGAYRKVDPSNTAAQQFSIDDLLPFYGDGTPISVLTYGRFDVWPSLVEKAYLKLMGGYDFPGSNSSTDIQWVSLAITCAIRNVIESVLTGWLPEHLEIKSADFESERTWTRIWNNYKEGRCLLTLGTDACTRSNADIDGIELMPKHSYAVVDIKEDTTDRWLTILKPSQVALAADDTDGLSRAMQALTLKQQSKRHDISWSKVCSIFDSLFLNWNPSIFRCRVDFHGLWRTKASRSTDQSNHFRINILLDRAKPGDIVWVLLTRHLVNKERQKEYIALHVQQEELSSMTLGSDSGALKGTYTDSVHTLSRYTMSGPTSPISVVASYDGPYENVGFTLSAFSFVKIQWAMETGKLPYTSTLEGAFTSKTAGGNSSYPTFMNNPQYRLQVHPPPQRTSPAGRDGLKATMRLTLEGARDTPLNLMLVWNGGGERVVDVNQNDVLASSGPYSHGVADALAKVTAGTYTLIISAFDPKHRGAFSLRVESTAYVEVTQIPAEGAGMFCKTVKAEWTSETSAGPRTSPSYFRNPSYEVDVPAATGMKIRLQLLKPSPTALNVTLFVAGKDQHSIGQQVMTSGPYTSKASGAVTPEINIPPGKYVAVASTTDPGCCLPFQFLFYTKAANIQVALKSEQRTP